MPISPEKSVSCKKAWCDAQFSHAGDLIFTRHLRVNNERSRLRPWILLTRGLDSIERVLNRGVPVSMNSD